MDIGAFEAKTHFSELIENVQMGKDYIITKRGKPVAKIIPYKGTKSRRREIVKSLSLYRSLDKSSFDIKSAIEDGRA